MLAATTLGLHMWDTKSSGFHQESGRFDSGAGVGVAESLTCGD